MVCCSAYLDFGDALVVILLHHFFTLFFDQCYNIVDTILEEPYHHITGEFLARDSVKTLLIEFTYEFRVSRRSSTQSLFRSPNSVGNSIVNG